MEGKLICGNCGHQYMIKEGIANFLLPSHLGQRCHSLLLWTVLTLHQSEYNPLISTITLFTPDDILVLVESRRPILLYSSPIQAHREISGIGVLYRESC